MANPCNKELALEFGGVHVGVFAEQVELSFPNDVSWIRYGEVVSKMFISYSELFNMVHVDSKDSTNGGVVK